MLTINTPFAVYYEKIRNHLGETATNGGKIHSFARKNGRLRLNQIQLGFLHFHQHSITFWGVQICVIRHTKEKNIFFLTPTDNRSKSNQSSERCSQSYFTDKLQRERGGGGRQKWTTIDLTSVRSRPFILGIFSDPPMILVTFFLFAMCLRHDSMTQLESLKLRLWARLHKTSVTTTGTRTCTRNLSQLHEIT